MEGSRRGSILVVDDERSVRDVLEIALSSAGHQVTCAESGATALRLLDERAFDVVLSDLTMPGIDGMEVLRHASARPDPPLVIMITAFATAETAVEAMRLGAYDYIAKPFKVDEIELVVARALERRALGAENLRLREELRGVARLDRMVGRSEAMRRVFEVVRRVAPTRASVLVVGESGTGKELVARAIHNLSDRSEGPFVAVNCGAIPPDLMESELFGHEKGAFTGASAARAGLFREAQGGTLFLDEIGELDPALQVKLLRVLQEKVVRPVGAAKETAVDCRVVAATNRDLERAVQAGEFRQDLYFRLNVVQVVLPPLRRRREDIPLLVERFFERACRDMNRPLEGISAEAMQWFLSYDYPGNVRELENLVERAVALESGPVLSAANLPAVRPATATADASGIRLPAEGIDLDRVLADIERDLLEQALALAGGVRQRAAELLRITPRSLRYRMTKLGLAGPSVTGTDS
ncbi:MAG: sigma-54-dependent Fis family transcriptional regulator [Deltaproteobacteria bacterium]|nr:MAG: sigma-54-dependent Fis family transcriptional regulator [Deltaproteobacteria bacterium]